jgi:hypothetical protein
VCDGRSGSPNLVGRFILGTINGGEINAVGGTSSHTHNEDTYTPQGGVTLGETHLDVGDWSGSNEPGALPALRSPHNHSIASADNLPPFVKLVYIMKL